MTTFESNVGSAGLGPASETTHDLIICRGERIVFHEHYASPALRLQMLAQLLELSDVVADAIDASRASQIRSLHESMSDRWSTDPDGVVDVIAKLCRAWDVQIYVSTTRKQSAVPETLFSVVTDYGRGEIAVEHFLTRAARRRSLVERADQCFEAPGRIPERVLVDDARLAALLSALLMPANVSLAEATLDRTAESLRYQPSGELLRIR